MIKKKWLMLLMVMVLTFVILGISIFASDTQDDGSRYYNFPIFLIIQQTLLVLAGAVGPSFLFFLQIKYAQRIRMDEKLAEKKIDVDSEAYIKMKKLQSMLGLQSPLEEVFKVILEQQDWLFKNRLFLPGKFPDKWITIREAARDAIHLKRTARPGVEKKLEKLRIAIKDKIDEAIDEIYKDTRASRLKIEPI